MKPKITRPKSLASKGQREKAARPMGPVQAKIICALWGQKRGMSAQEITDWINAYTGTKTTLCSVRDTLYRRMVSRGTVVKGPVSFRLPEGQV